MQDVGSYYVGETTRHDFAQPILVEGFDTNLDELAYGWKPLDA